MPRAFDITAAAESANLNTSGQGELSFTVSNALRMPVRARATVKMEGQAQSSWASVAGGEERDFSTDGTQQFTVKLQVPPGTPPGRYTFRLLVANVANTDEQFAEGPTVAFIVPEAPKQEAKKFPWWIIALAAGVLLIGGGVVFILLGRGGLDIGEPCKGTDDCGKGLTCSTATEGTCLGQDGFKGCKEDTQCLSGRCEAGTCAEAELGRNCGPGDSCPLRQKCTTVQSTRACLLAPGQECTGDVQCAGLFCNDGKCSRDDGKCSGDAECRPPATCSPNNLCLLPNGQTCTDNGVCLSGSCSGGKCQPAPLTCNPPCPRFSSCVSGRCMRFDVLPRVNEEVIRGTGRGVILRPRTQPQ